MLNTRWTTLFFLGIFCLGSMYSCTAANGENKTKNISEQSDEKTARTAINVVTGTSTLDIAAGTTSGDKSTTSQGDTGTPALNTPADEPTDADKNDTGNADTGTQSPNTAADEPTDGDNNETSDAATETSVDPKTLADNGDKEIGILPFSRLASANAQKQIGDYYQALGVENALVAALEKQTILVKNADPKGQQPFTYDEMSAPVFDIDADDFATPEQILGEIASRQKLTKIIFGHVEQISDSLLLVVRVYFASSGKIQSADEQSVKITGLTPKKVEKAIEKLAGEVKQIMQNPPPKQNPPPLPTVSDPPKVYNIDHSSPSTVMKDDDMLARMSDDSGLKGFDEEHVGYTVEDVYRMVLEYEFYVLPSNEAGHHEAIEQLVRLFSTTKQKLIDELKRSRSAKKTTYRYERRITKITSTPLKKGRFITPSTETFSLCIFAPEALHFGFRKQTYQDAKETLKKIKKLRFFRSGLRYDDWRIPTLKELFVITQYLPLKKRARKTGYFFWSSNLTAEKNRWTIRKFPTRFDRQGQPLIKRYGIDFVSTERKTDLALLVAVRDCR